MCVTTPETQIGMTWSLDTMYQANNDPQLLNDLEEADRRATQFAAAYRGKIQQTNITSSQLRDAMVEYEAIQELAMKPYLYAFLWSAEDKRDPVREALLQTVMERCRGIATTLLFFRLELASLSKQTLFRLTAHEDLQSYANVLRDLLRWKSHLLNEAGERFVRQELHPERQRFRTAYDKLLNSLRVDITREKEIHSISAPQLHAYLRSPQKSLRDDAFCAFFKVLSDHGTDFVDIMRALLRNHREECQRRGLQSLEQKSFLTNQVEPSVVHTMARSAESHYPEAREYLRLKARLLKTERLRSSDIQAPVTSRKLQLKFPEALKLVIRSLGSYHPLFRSILEGFHRGNWIDGTVQPGKWPGPFCKCLAPSQYPFISLLYEGNTSDLLMLAHELGHAVHYRLASAQRFLNFQPPPVLAEFSGTFFEILLVQHLLASSSSPVTETELLAAQMDSILTTVFRQHVISRFEKVLHSQPNLLGLEGICARWWEENVALYGDTVELAPEYRWGWTTIWHIFHKPFYCWSYVFGNLLSMVMFELYREGGPHVLNDLIAIWSAGASRRPAIMLEKMELEPSRSFFWDHAFRYVRRVLTAFRASAGQ